jgi:hypothetical protein
MGEIARTALYATSTKKPSAPREKVDGLTFRCPFGLTTLKRFDHEFLAAGRVGKRYAPLTMPVNLEFEIRLAGVRRNFGLDTLFTNRTQASADHSQDGLGRLLFDVVNLWGFCPVGCRLEFRTQDESELFVRGQRSTDATIFSGHPEKLIDKTYDIGRAQIR